MLGLHTYLAAGDCCCCCWCQLSSSNLLTEGCNAATLLSICVCACVPSKGLVSPSIGQHQTNQNQLKAEAFILEALDPPFACRPASSAESLDLTRHERTPPPAQRSCGRHVTQRWGRTILGDYLTVRRRSSRKSHVRRNPLKHRSHPQLKHVRCFILYRFILCRLPKTLNPGPRWGLADKRSSGQARPESQHRVP